MTSTPRGIQHVVLMRFPAPLDDAEDAQLRAMVASWPDKIGTMTECRVGSDLTGQRSRGWHYLLHTVFPDETRLQAYIDHPVHQELVAFLNERRCDRLAFDYFF
jgi:hypothetical protein